MYSSPDPFRAPHNIPKQTRLLSPKLELKFLLIVFTLLLKQLSAFDI